MLKLLYALACENVIVAQNGVTSIINILEQVESETPPDAPDIVMVAKSWQCIAFWTRGDVGVPEPITYEQRTLVITPDENVLFDIQVPFIVSNSHLNYRNVGSVNGFPITKSGTLRVEVYLRKKGEEDWGEKRSEYPIVTKRKIVEVPNDDKTKVEHVNNEVSI